MLDYRQMEESWAKDAYLASRAERVECEQTILEVIVNRSEFLAQPANTLGERQALERMLERLDGEERAHRIALEVLANEEEQALQTWHAKKRDLESLVKLREAEFEEWSIEVARREQRELDEWTSMRRTG